MVDIDIDKEISNFLRLSIEEHERDISRTVRYIQSLEAFMAAAAAALGCLPSYADPRPDGGNAHIMAKLNDLLVDKKKLAEALRMTINTLTEIYLQSESWQYERRPNPPWWNLGDNAKAAILRCSFLSRLDAEPEQGADTTPSLHRQYPIHNPITAIDAKQNGGGE